ncbi:DUF1684 domain-containing protein [Flavobacterium psychrophilum]|uniref:DUF1684 domain-containing protein n=1 Tax=Flavobacterium psychrophilum TaxID=96345 RepID=UPI0004F845E7|nr:DUF1684 domain-containing protein [Flavobacterium psychrophilum]AIN74476.1 hypothetical protein FPG3_09310 [Flavobacterium psychrophilum FPG3]EKT2068390.1 DUF1684 domain-containing protein [Flavobacterium psychrophilum]EKT2071468.1 DUF1684 domain-containing protein [Flavobacterium psychrophilum]EKT4490989.1 DUF1684 domain-containing protein [Flavobacterium psychrophilum]MBF2045555.1 DUF1684 domain-containing protein [Flavobacterium psychrophilum]
MKKHLILFTVLFFVISYAQDNKAETSQEFQNNLNKEYADKKQSPLSDEDFQVFKSLDFYPINEKFIVEAKFVRTKNAKIFVMKTSTTRLPRYKKYGELSFVIDEKQFNLNVYQNIDLSKREGYKDYLFLPFSDLTCGKESYLGGRYIDMRFPKSETVIINFNKAYNPYCAYNHKYSCPIVPLENDLKIEILAGVKKFND